MNTEPEECDHDYEFHNDSFDHEFGCELVHYYECRLCGKELEGDAFDESDDIDRP